MKIHLLSDLHFENQTFGDYTPPECDVVLLAGDLAEDFTGIEWAWEKFPNKPVLITPGNHEYYDRKQVVSWTLELMEYAAGTNVTILADSDIIIDDVVFIGATLWTDFTLFNKPHIHKHFAQKNLGDYKWIRRPSQSKPNSNKRHLRADDVIAFHRDSRRFIEMSLDMHDGNKRVVMTHHAPSHRSLEKMDDYAPAYAAPLEDLIWRWQPELWVHGHIHQSRDYTIGNTRVVANPRGRHTPSRIKNDPPYETLNPAFNPSLILEI